MRAGEPENTKVYLILPLLFCAALCAWGFGFKPLLHEREAEETEAVSEEEFAEAVQQLELAEVKEPEGFGLVIQPQNMTGDISLTGEQTALLKEYMNRYMESLAYLECLDFSDLFLCGGEALSESSIAFQIALRQMTDGADYSLLSYSYALICVSAEETQGGEVLVTAEETSTQVFAQTPDVKSRKYSVVHTFTMKMKNGKWYLTQHEQADSLYIVLASEGVEEEEIPERYVEVVAEYTELIRERTFGRTQEDVLLASAQETDVQKTDAQETDAQGADVQETDALKSDAQEANSQEADLLMTGTTGADTEEAETLKEAQPDEKTGQDVLSAEDTELNADHPYDRESAVAYSYMYIDTRNYDSFADYSDVGGNCQNFVSQCLYAGGIPMDTVGAEVWKWYDLNISNNGSHYGRSSSWTGVDEFVDYAENNTGYGLVAEVDAPYFTGEAGDVLQFGTEGDWRHAVLITDVVCDEDGSVIDYLVNSNTSNLENYPASLYGYPEVILTKIIGWNEE